MDLRPRSRRPRHLTVSRLVAAASLVALAGGCTGTAHPVSGPTLGPTRGVHQVAQFDLQSGVYRTLVTGDHLLVEQESQLVAYEFPATSPAWTAPAAISGALRTI